MDVHSFRIIGAQMLRYLTGARVEKIHAPLEGVFSFSLYAQGTKRLLVLRFGRKAPLFFLTRRRLENPPRPSAQAMRLRTYCLGRRLGEGCLDLASRRLAFPLPGPMPEGGEGETGRLFLLLDMVNGVDIVETLPGGFGEAVFWPEASLVDSLCRDGEAAEGEAEAWRDYPVLSPLLRESLACLEALEGRALLVDLEAGGGDLFLYADAKGKPAFYAAWPLPDEILRKRDLRPLSLEEAALAVESADPEAREAAFAEVEVAYREHFPALYAAGLVDSGSFFEHVRQLTHKEEAAPEKRRQKRVKRLLAKLDQEETRLKGMAAQGDAARLLQSVLWRFPAEAKAGEVVIPESGESMALDPRYTIRENMARMFHQAARGKRGLTMLEQRRAQAPYVGLDAPGEALSASGPAKDGAAGESTTGGAREWPFAQDGAAYKDVARFLSSDGYTLLRGKNAKGNHSLLRLGKGHDYWLHAEDGPGAHVIIRRAHAEDPVPERTLREAARLALEKSRLGGEGGGTVMLALLRHVHGLKGAKPGTVRVDVLLPSITLP
jgi:hypothetical protein